MAITNSSLPDDRKDILLKAAYDILKKCYDSHSVENALEVTAHYDGVDCDGMCLMEDIEAELGVEE